MKNIITLLSGLIFGLGLILSGMTNPAKVIGFLDLSGNWDPSLALVMVGAILIASIAFRYAEKNKLTVFQEPILLPNKNLINKELVIGSLIFGAGWAVAGFCPGPALVSLGEGHKEALVFVIAMILGMLLNDKLYIKLKK